MGPTRGQVNPPARRIKAFIDETYDLRQSDGDLYHYMRGHIVPLSLDKDPVVAHIHMITDANGFRNSHRKRKLRMASLSWATRSPEIAERCASPWTQKLAEQTEMDVFNLGDVGFGPQDELKMLQQYGLKKQPQWVIMAYFEE